MGGFDWGARTANVMAAPLERCRAMVSVSGYLIGSQAAGAAPLRPAAEQAWWYEYYFATERGRAGVRGTSPRLRPAHLGHCAPGRWRFTDATFQRSAAAFGSPDHVAVVIHNNLPVATGLAAAKCGFDALEQRLAAFPPIPVPTITLEGDANGALLLEISRATPHGSREEFAPDTHGGIGHNLPQEAPLTSSMRSRRSTAPP